MTAMAWLAVLVATPPVLAFATLLVAGGRRALPSLPDRVAPPFALLVPAHDEAAGIAAMLRSVRTQLRDGDRLLLVADNCTDATAAIARNEGADVIERDDPARIGKGFALAAGRDHLAADPRAVVIVLDADCFPAPGALVRLALVAARDRAAVQGCYLLAPPADASALVRVSCFAFLVKNLIRQRALRRLGAPALLQGTGMAFPWSLFAAAPLATASLVEDLELGLGLALAGHPVRFAEAARIASPAAATRATATQRRRWEHGLLATSLRCLPRLLASGHRDLLALAVDLAVPPLSLLATIALACLALTLPAMAAGTILPASVLVATLLLASLALAVRWHAEGRDLLPARMLPHLPLYFLWKLPVLFGARPRGWQRTGRAS